jgi:quinol-cytochrome oxidoreductase complex cytochrome b subunit
MVDIPEHLLLRSAEARAKALGITVEQALAEMKGEKSPTVVEKVVEPTLIESKEEVKPSEEKEEVKPSEEKEEVKPSEEKEEVKPSEEKEEVTTEPEVEEVDFAPKARITQRLLTVVKAKPIQRSASEPVDKVNTWPHLMLPEFVALMAMTAFLIFLSAILQAPLLAEANPNVTPNPAKAPWYFLGLQEALSYWDPQIAGVMIPGVAGVLGLMSIPYLDRNPSSKPSDRKFAIMMWTFFMCGAGILTIIGVLFRGPGWNWTYPWIDGIWFDDMLDWIYFE